MSTSPFSVDPARWRALEEVFHAALALPRDVRAAYLDAACGDDAAMRREVEQLLEADADPHATFGGEVLRVSEQAMQALQAELHETAPGSLVGRSAPTTFSSPTGACRRGSRGFLGPRLEGHRLSNRSGDLPTQRPAQPASAEVDILVRANGKRVEVSSVANPG